MWSTFKHGHMLVALPGLVHHQPQVPCCILGPCRDVGEVQHVLPHLDNFCDRKLPNTDNIEGTSPQLRRASNEEEAGRWQSRYKQRTATSN